MKRRIVTSALVVFALVQPALGKDQAKENKKPATPVNPAKPKAEKLDKVTASHTFSLQGEDSADYAAQIKPGQLLEVVLDENVASSAGLWILSDADTGQQLASKGRKGWTCADADSGILVMQGPPVAGDPQKPNPSAAGAAQTAIKKAIATVHAGTLRWSFVAKKEGRQTLRFVFRRPWEKPSEDELAVVYAVTVAKDAKPGVTAVAKKKTPP